MKERTWEGKGPLCWSCPGGPRHLLLDDGEGCPQAICPCLPSAASPLRVPSGRVTLHRARQVKAAQEAQGSGWGALVLALTPCYTDDPAREAHMKRRIHEGRLSQDKHKRYCLYESGVPEYKMLTCTSGCRLEVWLNRTWIAGHVEGDGEDYWLFADAGGRFLLAEHMRARYIEHWWRSGIEDISGICSSPSIRLMLQKWRIYGYCHTSIYSTDEAQYCSECCVNQRTG